MALTSSSSSELFCIGDNIATSFVLLTTPSDSDMDLLMPSDAEDFGWRPRTLLPKFFRRAWAGDAEKSKKQKNMFLKNGNEADVKNAHDADVNNKLCHLIHLTISISCSNAWLDWPRMLSRINNSVIWFCSKISKPRRAFTSSIKPWPSEDKIF